MFWSDYHILPHRLSFSLVHWFVFSSVKFVEFSCVTKARRYSNIFHLAVTVAISVPDRSEAFIVVFFRIRPHQHEHINIDSVCLIQPSLEVLCSVCVTEISYSSVVIFYCMIFTVMFYNRGQITYIRT